MKKVTQKEINRAWAEYQSRVNQYGEHEMGAQRALQSVYELKALWEKQNPGRKSNPALRESDIVYENGDFWVCREKGKYTVYRNGLTHSTSDSSYALNADGLSLAKARCDYKAKHSQSIHTASKRKSNPAPRGPAGGERLEMLKAAGKLYREFTGDEGELVAKVKKLVWPQVATVIGEMDGVLYSTVRDGVDEKYIHRFKKSARPLLCVSHDGSMLVIVLGKYRFTDRGIVDK